MKKHGNLCAKAIYEAEVPPFYYVPQSKDCLVLREQWIRAKYERKEFIATSISHDACTSGSREGFLWKRGRDSKQFLPRQFILSARDGVLKYYTKESKGPKAVISIKDLNAMFQTEKIPNSHGLQITYNEGGRTRNLFVYHESGKLVPQITRSYFKEGYMEKTGPTDAFETGRVIIGSKEHGYEVRASLPRGVKGRRWKAGLTIVTPKREFVFACENDREQEEWMEALNEIISQPMTA
ncbi:arf-GAP with dual PH domain-containing protein 2 isoform X4 [Alligator sinensis]|uniref:Arf-GAP with dual PH domain-containing protein 2 isoform X4 n=1 Tax=Alligator sinensis TaxID=38654 RepID=A0A3Q0G137_ALLSI|nr:arf-GAP with dual PH domain-containing protein 2 isoform X4 [Alligator sinensis]